MTTYWTIVFPGEFGQHVQETWTEDQILKSYYSHWCEMMVQAGKGAGAGRQRDCINDWTIVYWAEKTNEFGVKL